MRRWTAVSETGRTYESREHGIVVGGYGYYSNPTMGSFPQSDFESFVTPQRTLDWNKLLALPPIEAPVVGERFVITTRGDAGWRISTPIASVTFHDDSVIPSS